MMVEGKVKLHNIENQINPGITKKILLLVEDEALIALDKKNELTKYGYNIITVNTGEKAVAIIRENDKIDLILMDIDLGNGIDGTEAAELILRDKNLPIVFLSSHTEPHIVEKTEKITSYGYVVKSSSITVLDASVKMAFKLFEANRTTEEHRHHLGITLNSIGDAFIATDTEGNVTNINPVAELLTGWDFEEAYGTPLSEVFTIINTDSRQPVENPVYKVLASGETVDLANHTVLISKNGHEYQIADSAAPIIHPDGLITGVVLVFRDVTKEYKLQKKIRESEEKFNQITRSIETILWEYDIPKDCWTYVSPQSQKILGYVPEDWTNLKFWTDHIHEDDRGWAEKYCADCTSRGESHEFEYRFFKKNGELVWLRDIVNVELNNGVPEKMYGFMSDITDYKNTELALKNSEYLLRESQKIASLGSYILDITSGIWKSSIILDDLFGIDGNYFKDVSSWLQIVHEEDRIMMQDYFTINILKNREPFNKEYRIKRISDQRLCWVHGKGEFETDNEGNPLKMIGTIQDITKRKQAEHGLQNERDNLGKILEAMKDGVYIVNQEFDIQYANSSMIKDLGSYKEKKCHEYFYNQKSVCSWCKFPEILSGKTVHREWVFPKNGDTYDLIETPIKNQDGSISKLKIFRDITNRKRAEDEVKRQLSEKETILKETHHRIKNNFASIGSLLSLQANSITNSEAQSALQDAIGRVSSMQVLYEKLLLTDDYQVTSVREYLDNLIDEIIGLFPVNPNQKIEKKIDDFQLDPKRLVPIGIIVNELLTNIMKYGFTGRDSGLIEVYLKEDNGNVTLTLQDNGNGLPEGFDVDTQEGFGLMLVKILSEQLHGSFIIEDNNGTRSTLEFSI